MAEDVREATSLLQNIAEKLPELRKSISGLADRVKQGDLSTAKVRVV